VKPTGKTILIYCPTGESRGVRVAEITTGIVQAVVVPRAKLAEASKRPEFSGVGRYLLFGEPEAGGLPMAYMGESEDCCDRISQHSRSRRPIDSSAIGCSELPALLRRSSPAAPPTAGPTGRTLAARRSTRSTTRAPGADSRLRDREVDFDLLVMSTGTWSRGRPHTVAVSRRVVELEEIAESFVDHAVAGHHPLARDHAPHDDAEGDGVGDAASRWRGPPCPLFGML